MNYKFTPGSLLLIFLFITLVHRQQHFIIVNHADNLQEKVKIQAKVIHVDNHTTDDAKGTILVLKSFQQQTKRMLDYMVLYVCVFKWKWILGLWFAYVLKKSHKCVCAYKFICLHVHTYLECCIIQISLPCHAVFDHAPSKTSPLFCLH